MNTKPIPLGDLFLFPSIRGITEHYIYSNPGRIPVYGGRKTGNPIGYVTDNLDNVKYFENCLAWNRQGSVGYVFLHKHRFTTTDDHRPMHLKEEYKDKVDLEYLQIQIQAALLSSGFAWGKTAGKDKIKNIYIDVPVDENGNIDILMQKRLLSRYLPVRVAQKRLIEYQGILNRAQVQVHNSFKCIDLFLSNEALFSLEIGKRVRKKDLLSDGIPVYSANVIKPFGYIIQTGLNSFANDSLIWGIDGNFDWAHIPKNVIFSITDHCGRLQVKSPDILSKYLYYQLRESSSAYGFNRTYRASLQNIKSVSICVPIKDDGKFDIFAQKELIERYEKIDFVKQKLSILIDSAVVPQVEV